MKWGVFFGKKSGKWGVFCKKKVDLSSTQGALCTVLVFFILHFAYCGCVGTQRTPLPTGLHLGRVSRGTRPKSVYK